jgi:uncharacterized protein YuzE
MKREMHYDPEADALAVSFAPDGAIYDGTEEIAPNVFLDFDTEGRVIGVEILGVREGIASGRFPLPAPADKPATAE